MVRKLFYFLSLMTVASFVATIYAAHLPSICVAARVNDYSQIECDYRGFVGLTILTCLFLLSACVAAYVIHADQPAKSSDA